MIQTISAAHPHIIATPGALFATVALPLVALFLLPFAQLFNRITSREQDKAVLPRRRHHRGGGR